MRDAANYRSAVRIYTIAEQMDRMAKDMHDNTTHEQTYMRDIINGIRTSLAHVMSSSSQDAKDEFDFGPNGHLFEYTLKNNIKKALEEMGFAPKVNGDKS